MGPPTRQAEADTELTMSASPATAVGQLTMGNWRYFLSNLDPYLLIIGPGALCWGRPFMAPNNIARVLLVDEDLDGLEQGTEKGSQAAENGEKYVNALPSRK